jgi:hypothetical protein
VTITDEKLMACADGELDASAAAEVEAAMARDPSLARRVAQFQAQARQLRDAFDPVLAEPLPARLTAAVAGIVGIEARRRAARRRWGVPEFGAMAASLLVGVLVSWVALRTVGSPPIVSSAAGLVARGELARALSEDLASEASAGPVRLGVSFRDRSGAYCRSFALDSDNRIVGLACRPERTWQVLLAARDPGSSMATDYRQAASSAPPEVRRLIEERIDGEPLDAAGEKTARDRGWRD